MLELGTSSLGGASRSKRWVLDGDWGDIKTGAGRGGDGGAPARWLLEAWAAEVGADGPFARRAGLGNSGLMVAGWGGDLGGDLEGTELGWLAGGALFGWRSRSTPTMGRLAVAPTRCEEKGKERWWCLMTAVPCLSPATAAICGWLGKACWLLEATPNIAQGKWDAVIAQDVSIAPLQKSSLAPVVTGPSAGVMSAGAWLRAIRFRTAVDAGRAGKPTTGSVGLAPGNGRSRVSSLSAGKSIQV